MIVRAAVLVVVVGLVSFDDALDVLDRLRPTQLANAGSDLLPVSNLTNPLVFSATGLTFGGFAVRMLLPKAAASPATLLWRRVVCAEDLEPSRGAFFRLALLATPLALVLSTVALWFTLRIID